MRGESVSAYSVNVGPSLLQAGQKWATNVTSGRCCLEPGLADNLRASCPTHGPGDEQISARGKIPQSRTKRLNGSLCEKRDIIV